MASLHCHLFNTPLFLLGFWNSLLHYLFFFFIVVPQQHLNECIPLDKPLRELPSGTMLDTLIFVKCRRVSVGKRLAHKNNEAMQSAIKESTEYVEHMCGL